MFLNKILNISKSLSLMLILSYTSLLYAEDNITTIYKDIDLGIEIEYNGSDWKRIRSFGSANLNFGDEIDKQQAIKIATLRAKANIVKFMKEKIQTEDTLDGIAKTLVKTDKNGKLISKSAARKTSTALIEKITSSSDAILKGILLLETKEKESYVKVTVGVSRKSMSIANSLKYNFKKDTDIEDKTQQKPNNSGEIRRSKNYDNF